MEGPEESKNTGRDGGHPFVSLLTLVHTASDSQEWEGVSSSWFDTDTEPETSSMMMTTASETGLGTPTPDIDNASVDASVTLAPSCCSIGFSDSVNVILIEGSDTPCSSSPESEEEDDEDEEGEDATERSGHLVRGMAKRRRRSRLRSFLPSSVSEVDLKKEQSALHKYLHDVVVCRLKLLREVLDFLDAKLFDKNVSEFHAQSDCNSELKNKVDILINVFSYQCTELSKNTRRMVHLGLKLLKLFKKCPPRLSKPEPDNELDVDIVLRRVSELQGDSGVWQEAVAAMMQTLNKCKKGAPSQKKNKLADVLDNGIAMIANLSQLYGTQQCQLQSVHNAQDVCNTKEEEYHEKLEKTKHELEKDEQNVYENEETLHQLESKMTQSQTYQEKLKRRVTLTSAQLDMATSTSHASMHLSDDDLPSLQSEVQKYKSLLDDLTLEASLLEAHVMSLKRTQRAMSEPSQAQEEFRDLDSILQDSAQKQREAKSGTDVHPSTTIAAEPSGSPGRELKAGEAATKRMTIDAKEEEKLKKSKREEEQTLAGKKGQAGAVKAGAAKSSARPFAVKRLHRQPDVKAMSEAEDEREEQLDNEGRFKPMGQAESEKEAQLDKAGRFKPMGQAESEREAQLDKAGHFKPMGQAESEKEAQLDKAGRFQPMGQAKATKMESQPQFMIKAGGLGGSGAPAAASALGPLNLGTPGRKDKASRTAKALPVFSRKVRKVILTGKLTDFMTSKKVVPATGQKDTADTKQGDAFREKIIEEEKKYTTFDNLTNYSASESEKGSGKTTKLPGRSVHKPKAINRSHNAVTPLGVVFWDDLMPREEREKIKQATNPSGAKIFTEARRKMLKGRKSKGNECVQKVPQQGKELVKPTPPETVMSASCSSKWRKRNNNQNANPMIKIVPPPSSHEPDYPLEGSSLSSSSTSLEFQLLDIAATDADKQRGSPGSSTECREDIAPPSSGIAIALGIIDKERQFGWNKSVSGGVDLLPERVEGVKVDIEKEARWLEAGAERGVHNFMALRDVTTSELLDRNLPAHAKALDVLRKCDMKDSQCYGDVQEVVDAQLHSTLHDFGYIFSNALRELHNIGTDHEKDDWSSLRASATDAIPVGLDAWSKASMKTKTKEEDYSNAVSSFCSLWASYNRARAELYIAMPDLAQAHSSSITVITEDIEGEEQEELLEEKQQQMEDMAPTVFDAMPKAVSCVPKQEEQPSSENLPPTWKQDLDLAKEAFREGNLKQQDYLEQVFICLKMAALLQLKLESMGNSFTELRVKQILAGRVKSILGEVTENKRQLRYLQQMAGVADYAQKLEGLNDMERDIRIKHEQMVLSMAMIQSHANVRNQMRSRMMNCDMNTIEEEPELQELSEVSSGGEEKDVEENKASRECKTIEESTDGNMWIAISREKVEPSDTEVEPASEMTEQEQESPDISQDFLVRVAQSTKDMPARPTILDSPDSSHGQFVDLSDLVHLRRSSQLTAMDSVDEVPCEDYENIPEVKPEKRQRKMTPLHPHSCTAMFKNSLLEKPESPTLLGVVGSRGLALISPDLLAQKKKKMTSHDISSGFPERRKSSQKTTKRKAPLLPFMSGTRSSIELQYDPVTGQPHLGIDSVVASFPSLENVERCLKTRHLDSEQESSSKLHSQSFLPLISHDPLTSRSRAKEKHSAYYHLPRPASDVEAFDYEVTEDMLRTSCLGPTSVHPSITISPTSGSFPEMTMHLTRRARTARPSSPISPHASSRQLSATSTSRPLAVLSGSDDDLLPRRIMTLSSSELHESFAETSHYGMYLEKPVEVRRVKTPPPSLHTDWLLAKHLHRLGETVHGSLPRASAPSLASMHEHALDVPHVVHTDKGRFLEEVEARWRGRHELLVDDLTKGHSLPHPSSAVKHVKDWVRQNNKQTPQKKACKLPAVANPLRERIRQHRSVRRVLKRHQKLHDLAAVKEIPEETPIDRVDSVHLPHIQPQGKPETSVGWPTADLRGLRVKPVLHDPHLLCLDIDQSRRKAGRIMRLMTDKKLRLLRTDKTCQHIWNKFDSPVSFRSP